MFGYVFLVIFSLSLSGSYIFVDYRLAVGPTVFRVGLPAFSLTLDHVLGQAWFGSGGAVLRMHLARWHRLSCAAL